MRVECFLVLAMFAEFLPAMSSLVSCPPFCHFAGLWVCGFGIPWGKVSHSPILYSSISLSPSPLPPFPFPPIPSSPIPIPSPFTDTYTSPSHPRGGIPYSTLAYLTVQCCAARKGALLGIWETGHGVENEWDWDGNGKGRVGGRGVGVGKGENGRGGGKKGGWEFPHFSLSKVTRQQK